MNYWKDKARLSAVAMQHTQDMESKYATQIQDCADSSVIYSEGDILWADHVNTKFIVQATTSVEAIKQHQSPNTCVLNFASHKEPGGRFLEGSSAQEESLCHSSYLYNVLSKLQGYYDENKKELNRGLYTNRAIYTPNVIFDDEYVANVLTCAAPNWKTAHEYCRVSSLENHDALASRIDFMLKVAAAHKVEVLILGAWGCGVFGQDPEHVAKIMHLMLTTKYARVFRKVVFAVPDENGVAHKAFKQVFAR